MVHDYITRELTEPIIQCNFLHPRKDTKISLEEKDKKLVNIKQKKNNQKKGKEIVCIS